MPIVKKSDFKTRTVGLSVTLYFLLSILSDVDMNRIKVFK